MSEEEREDEYEARRLDDRCDFCHNVGWVGNPNPSLPPGDGQDTMEPCPKCQATP